MQSSGQGNLDQGDCQQSRPSQTSIESAGVYSVFVAKAAQARNPATYARRTRVSDPGSVPVKRERPRDNKAGGTGPGPSSTIRRNLSSLYPEGNSSSSSTKIQGLSTDGAVAGTGEAGSEPEAEEAAKWFSRASDSRFRAEMRSPTSEEEMGNELLIQGMRKVASEDG